MPLAEAAEVCQNLSSRPIMFRSIEHIWDPVVQQSTADRKGDWRMVFRSDREYIGLEKVLERL